MITNQITSNFWFSEFRPHGVSKNWRPTSKYQETLIRNLAENLQIIRSSMPPKAWIQISGGVRTEKDYQRLINSGYNPSERSDHYCGYAPPLKIGSDNYRKFGSTYNFSTGAADCTPHGMNVDDFFSLAISKTRSGICYFSQVILEKNPIRKTAWVHFGGDQRPIFSPYIIRFLGKQQFLQSLNNGKTYSIVVM